MGEVLRLGRYLNVLLGLIVAAAPWMLDSAGTTYTLLSTTIGVLVIVLAIPRGPKTERYAGWDRYIR